VTPGRPGGAASSTKRGVAIAGVAVLVVSVLALGMALADDSAEDGTDGLSWDSIAAVDRETGAVTLVDREGSEIDQFDTGVTDVSYVLGNGGRLAVVADDAGAVLDVAAGTAEAPPLADGAQTVRVRTSEPLVLASAPPEGGDLTIVLATTTLDVAELAQLDDPLMAPNGVHSDPAGTVFAVADIRAGKTVALGIEPDDVALLPGLPVGISEQYVVTIELGQATKLNFSSLQGDLVSSVDLPRVDVAVLGADGDAILITESGDVLRASPGDDEAEHVATVRLAGDVLGAFPALGGQRLLVVAGQGAVVLDGHGVEVATVQLDGPWQRQDLITNPSQRCAVLLTEDGIATMIDLQSGGTLGAVDDRAFVAGWSTDGCTASLIGRDDRSSVIRLGSEMRLERDERVAAISPAGDHLVVGDRAGRAWLRDLDAEDSDDIPLDGNPDLMYAFVDH
jgi:hypothetical protein